jgi:Na+/H+-dicarboxylate symporter
MLIAVTIGLVLVTTIKPGSKITANDTSDAKVAYDADTETQARLADRPQGVLGAMQNLVEQIIPTNIVRAAAEGKALPVIFFSILLGIALTTMGDKGQSIIAFVSALFEAIMKLVHVVIWLTPMGVFALLAWAVARIGLGVFTEAIGTYMITVLVGLSIHAFIVLPLICVVFARCNPFRYMHQMRQALLTALGTDSSSATLPVTIECATKYGGVREKSAGFVLPLGATVNMDGTALYEGVAVVFLAQAYGIELSLMTLVLVAITATFAAVGAAGIPSAGLVTMVIVVDTVNGTLEGIPGSATIPIAAIGLIVGVDRILDMFRTTVNVWGDAVGAKLVDRLT